jgi:RNA polymerase sigma-70 factor, ECF subfamily
VTSEPETPREAAEAEKWIGEARQGNQQALGRLLEMCRHYLLLAANKELAPALWAKIAPSDIVQESLMEAGRIFPRFHGSSEEELLAWLRGILRNIVADAHRHYTTEKRQVANEVPLAEVPQLEMPLDPGESPSREAQAREQDEQLEKALRQLPEHYRQVLRLYTMDRLTFVQIAEKLGSSADAVRKLWRRALEELKKHLDAPHEST